MSKAWSAEYNGHTIKVVNSLKAALFIDGKEVDKQKDIINFVVSLRGQIPCTDEEVIAVLDGINNPLKVNCHIIVGKVLTVSDSE